MTQNIELEKVKAKIRALSARTIDNGATEAEAVTAMKKVGELLGQFNLTMTEVTVRDEQCVQRDVDTGSKHKGIQYMVALAVATFTGCKVWQTSHTKTKQLHFFGLESDVEMAVYLINYVKVAYDNSYAEFKQSDMYVNFQGHRRSLNSNYVRGFSDRLSDRLYEMAAQTNRDNNASAETGTALVIVEKDKYVEEEFGKLGMRLRKTQNQSNYRRNYNAQAAGSKAGGKVNLNRPVSKSSSFGGYLS